MGIFLRDLLDNLQESDLTRGQVFWYNEDRTLVLLDSCMRATRGRFLRGGSCKW